MYDVVTPIYGWISIGWGNTNDNGFLKEKLVRLCESWHFASIVMACTWWWSSIEACIVIILIRCWYDDVIEMSWLCEDVRLCLRWNDIRLVMNCLCALSWHNDDNVLFSQMRVVLKGYSHVIPIEIMIMIYKGLVSYGIY